MKSQICVGGFVIKNDRFLFGKRSNKKKWAPGVWDIIGGRCLKNEHPLLSLRREAFEEIGVNILNAELVKSLDVVDDSKYGTFTYHIFVVTALDGKPVNCSNEHTKIKWFTRNQLDGVSLALPGYTMLIDEWLAKLRDT